MLDVFLFPSEHILTRSGLTELWKHQEFSLTISEQYSSSRSHQAHSLATFTIK
jgi:hypothetical protein